jgi:hypothetical protein
MVTLNNNAIDTQDKTLIMEVATFYKLGGLITEPEEIKINSLNRIWKIKTINGTFCIKRINSTLYTKDNFPRSYNQAEKIAQSFATYIPTVTAISFEDAFINKIGDFWYIVYPFVTGKAIDSFEAITEKDIRSVATLAAKLHNINLQCNDTPIRELEKFSNEHWSNLIEEAKSPELLGLKDTILKWNLKYQKSSSKLKPTILSHRDINFQNILWDEQGNYRLLDWEHVGLTHPSVEVLGNAMEWAGIFIGKMNVDKFKLYLDTYLQEVKEHDNLQFKEAFYVWLGGRVLSFMELNLRRANFKYTQDEIEREKGIEMIEKYLIPCFQYIKNNLFTLNELMSSAEKQANSKIKKDDKEFEEIILKQKE